MGMRLGMGMRQRARLHEICEHASGKELYMIVGLAVIVAEVGVRGGLES